MLGYVFALISSLFFAIYIVPRKLTKTNPVIFSLLMSIGFFIGSVFLYLLKPFLRFNEVLSTNLLWALPAGTIWAVSFIAFVKSIDLIGISRSGQWKNLQGPIAVILGLILLSEYVHTNFLFAFLAALTIFVSAIFLSSTGKQSTGSNNKGITLGALSGVGFGLVSVINKFVTIKVGVYSQQVIWSLGIMLSLFAFVILNSTLKNSFKQLTKRDLKLGLSAGFLYLGASFFMLQSYRLIPVSVGITIIQLSIIWVVAIGIFIFKEINIKKYYRNILIGIFLAVLGIVFLFFTNK